MGRRLITAEREPGGAFLYHQRRRPASGPQLLACGQDATVPKSSPNTSP
jgi:hypothetical protein